MTVALGFAHPLAVPDGVRVPVAAVTASGSRLDRNISPANTAVGDTALLDDAVNVLDLDVALDAGAGHR
jgi:K+-transporting ATPase c subunit